MLDVGSQELEIGLRSQKVGGAINPQLFLADSLENGAGYCTHLGEIVVFGHLLVAGATYMTELALAKHSDDCSSSCYDCLREYTNMAFHPLLDWRLAGDMLSLLTNGTADLRVWEPIEAKLALGFANDFGGDAMQLDGGAWGVKFSNKALIVSHPLEDPKQNRRLVQAKDDLEAGGYGDSWEKPIVPYTSFDLLRRPGWVYSELFK
jgi:hypothetical protein